MPVAPLGDARSERSSSLRAIQPKHTNVGPQNEGDLNPSVAASSDRRHGQHLSSPLVFATYHEGRADRETLGRIVAMSSSALKHHPGARVVLLTDKIEDALRKGIPECVQVEEYGLFFEEQHEKEPLEVLRGGVKVRELSMYNRAYAESEFLLQTQKTAKLFGSSPPNIVFCDCDILFLAPIDALFDKNFSIAFTVRKHHEGMNINNGIRYVNGKEITLAANFYESWMEVLNNQEEKTWFGDQIALMDIFGRDLIPFKPPPRDPRNSGHILFLPVGEYNHCDLDINSLTNPCDAPPKHVRVLHLKAKLKKFMLKDSCKRFAVVERGLCDN